MTQAKTFRELSADEFFEIAKLRSEVFFVEQRIPIPDFDDADRAPDTVHWWLEDSAGLSAYARSVVLPEPEAGATRSLGRVAVRVDRRGEGLAQKVVAAILESYPGEPFVIHAQSYVVGLYERLGFNVIGPEFLEAEIPHRTMRRGVA